ncbi:hypothetical protein QJ48_21155 [Paenibacillus sp. A3]|uniref:hypothetical protein n=1 Tax=Paenibacillus sp. A3 TaxID=1337054 RepID=UPI0006D55D63|nr:hypothetical protein [Paenibacillus sp. A3]KPV57599.1 hypothetical protein QJ48_21155 [Paenibacillus sp. A3]
MTSGDGEDRRDCCGLPPAGRELRRGKARCVELQREQRLDFVSAPTAFDARADLGQTAVLDFVLPVVFAPR